MNLEEMYCRQRSLDSIVLQLEYKRTNTRKNKEELIEDLHLALLVEIGGLAKTTKCFNYSGRKWACSNYVMLDKFADVWYFYLSLTDQLEFELNYLIPEDFYSGALNKLRGDTGYSESRIVTNLFTETIRDLSSDGYSDKSVLEGIATNIQVIAKLLGFSNKEIEKAYMSKYDSLKIRAI